MWAQVFMQRKKRVVIPAGRLVLVSQIALSFCTNTSPNSPTKVSHPLITSWVTGPLAPCHKTVMLRLSPGSYTKGIGGEEVVSLAAFM